MPVFRLHNDCNPFNYRTTWSFGSEARQSMITAFRLRHRLIPYIYTSGVTASLESRTLIEPMYYEYPMCQDAYEHRNSYLFGTQLVAAPITQKKSPATQLGKTTAWLPPGRWVDVLSGLCYDGDRTLNLFRSVGNMPLLAKEGAIIPLDVLGEPKHGVHLPEHLEIVLVVGANGEFILYEDDGRGNDMSKIEFSQTPLRYDQSTGSMIVGPTTNALAGRRTWSLYLPACITDTVSVNGDVKKAIVSSDGARVDLGSFAASSSFEVIIDKPTLRSNDWRMLCWERIDRTNTDFGKKKAAWNSVRGLFNSVLFYEQLWHPGPPAPTPRHIVISRLLAVGVDKDLEDCLMEILLAEV